ncbi:GNAT family N-acetyltransferase [Aestuariibacter sp. A3R04]|uniref:GNAT family N-acetyltransferase n=1 Tax=Aestuariibacter sp. A3R04 TaxID=2841571 RepID=UPI001C09DFF9|nr:GNAT family N-acetyltransferase [Aestuariibacter sp. A3R04]MBU3021304.1 GNAT family N-acetyltransferase [Aestuariibacter sp. A3R04]
MHVSQLNIRNLTSLWKKYGASIVAEKFSSALLTSNSWPYRAWIEGQPDLALQIAKTPHTHRLFTWPDGSESQIAQDTLTQRNSKWQFEFKQTAMYLPISNYQTTDVQDDNFLLSRVTNYSQLREWLAISSEAFNYEMDEDVFTPLIDDSDIEIYLGKVNQKPAVSALLFKTDNVTGLHQMGVKHAFQGQGLAKKAMHLLLRQALRHQSAYMVLQASEPGLPLYRSLGFESIFELTYLKANSTSSKS